MGVTRWRRAWHGLRLGLLLLPAIGVLVAGAGLAAAHQGADPGVVEELAVRLLSPPYGPPGAAGDVRLYPGTLPPDLPLVVPVPEGARLIGSMARPAVGSPGPVSGAVGAPPTGTSYAVVLDVPGDAAAVQTLYAEAFTEQGWNPPPAFVANRPGGFVAGNVPPLNQYFCRSAAGPYVSLLSAARPDLPVDVRVMVEPNAGPCAAPPPPSGPGGPPGATLLPVLTAPASVQLTSNYSASGPTGRFTSEATAAGNTTTTDLEAHFATQLAAAGWTRLDGRVDGPLAWSRWQVIDDAGEAWQGFLYVLEGPGPGMWSLHVDVVSRNASGSGATVRATAG